MTTLDMTSILEQLASGHIDAAEAARRIDAMKAADAAASADAAADADLDETPQPAHPATTESTPEPTNEELASFAPTDEDAWAVSTDRPQRPSHPVESFPGPVEPVAEVPAPEPSAEPTRPRPTSSGGVERISVRAVGRRVRIVGETAVATLSADGPHVLRRNGAVLEVSSDGELGASLDGFSILRGAPRNLDDIRALGLGKELLLKVNPNIIVDVEVTAGSLNTERVPHLGKVRVTAGGAKLLDVTEANDVLVQAGSATIKGAITAGRNRIRAESGSLSITLADDSNVTVTGEAQLGKISWAGGHSGAVDEVVMGNGSARLEVAVVMGHAQIRVGSDRPVEEGVA